MRSAPRLLDPLRRDGDLLAAAPRLARLFGEHAPSLRAALDAGARVIAGGAAALAASPFGIAQLQGAALRGPFDAAFPVLDDRDLGTAPRVSGGSFADGSAAAIGLFGVEAIVRLAGALSAATGISTLSAARLPAVVVPALLAACRDEALRQGEDPAGLARALLRDAAGFAAAPHAMRIALAAGWTVAVEEGAGHAAAERQAEAGGLA